MEVVILTKKFCTFIGQKWCIIKKNYEDICITAEFSSVNHEKMYSRLVYYISQFFVEYYWMILCENIIQEILKEWKARIFLENRVDMTIRMHTQSCFVSLTQQLYGYNNTRFLVLASRCSIPIWIFFISKNEIVWNVLLREKLALRLADSWLGGPLNPLANQVPSAQTWCPPSNCWSGHLH